MDIIQNLLTPDFWHGEEIAGRDTLIELVRIAILYIVCRFLINRLAYSVARAAIYGVQHFGKAAHPAGEARLRTTIGLVRSVGIYFLTFICGVMLLRALNFDAVSVITGASVAGVAVGFGAQKLFKDVIAGFFIIFENQYSVGDYVTVNSSVTGHVEEIGMRIVKIRDDSGKLFIIANGDIALVCNLSRGAISSIVEMGVPPGSDMVKVRKVLEDAARDVFEVHKENGYTKPPTFEGVSGGDSTRTVIRVIVQVDDPSQLASATTLLRDVSHSKLLAEGITPF